MKNSTSQETRYPVSPTLRVAFKNEEIVEAKDSKTGRSKKQVEQMKSKNDLPMFDDYRIKAKDHDPL